MIDVVCWKWTQPGYRSKFEARHVNILRNMVARHYNAPHRFSCITDDPKGIDGDIRVIPLWTELGEMPNPSFRNGPSCYRRLKAFSAEAADIIGPRFVSLDLDLVLVNDMRPVWDRPEDFVIWGDSLKHKGYWYNGSMWLMRAGTRRQVWDRFDPKTSPALANAAGRRGSDQGWISHCLGLGEATWSMQDGLYSFRNHLDGGRLALPDNARAVIMHGHVDPWSKEVQHLSWIKQHYN